MDLMSWVKSFENIIEAWEPFILTAVGIAFPEAPLVVKAVQAGIGLMPVVQKAYDGIEGAGAAKKEDVQNVVASVLSGVASVSTGGQAETIAKVQAFSSPLIDGLCGLVNTLAGKDVIIEDNNAIGNGVPG